MGKVGQKGGDVETVGERPRRGGQCKLPQREELKRPTSKKEEVRCTL